MPQPRTPNTDSKRTDSNQTDPNRQASGLNERLNKRLLAYAATAGAAGVSLLAMTQAAEAEIVYTPTNRTIHSGSVLDLNNDGIHDYFFHGPFAICGTCYYFDVWAVKSNKLLSHGAPQAAGVTVGPGDKLSRGAGEMTDFCTCSGHSASGGPWAGVTDGYMGFEFRIDDVPHFGWARLSVTKTAGIVLTGYAYETIPLKPIVTGDTGGNDNADNNDTADERGSSAAPELSPAGLGRLALGAIGKAGQ
jgi:hypothetical protein